MKYENIKKAKISHTDIANFFGYKNVNSFRCSSAHKRIMQGVDSLIQGVKRKILSDFLHWFAGNETMSNSSELEEIIDIYITPSKNKHYKKN